MLGDAYDLGRYLFSRIQSVFRQTRIADINDPFLYVIFSIFDHNISICLTFETFTRKLLVLDGR